MRFQRQEAAGLAFLKSERANFSDGTNEHKWKVSLGCWECHPGAWWQMVPACRDKGRADAHHTWADSNAICSGIKELWDRCRQDKLTGVPSLQRSCLPSPGAGRVDKPGGAAESAVGLKLPGEMLQVLLPAAGTQPRPISAWSQESFGAASPYGHPG